MPEGWARAAAVGFGAVVIGVVAALLTTERPGPAPPPGGAPADAAAPGPPGGGATPVPGRAAEDQGPAPGADVRPSGAPSGPASPASGPGEGAPEGPGAPAEGPGAPADGPGATAAGPGGSAAVSAWLRWPEDPADDPPPPPLLVRPPVRPAPPGPGAWSFPDDLAPPGGAEVVFVRVLRVEVGGSFEVVGGPELVLAATHAGRRFIIWEDRFGDLPRHGLRNLIAPETSPFRALPAAGAHALELAVWDDDLFDDDLISRTVAPLAVEVAALPLDEEVVVEGPGTRIAGVAEPPRFAAGYVRAPVRGADAAARWGLRRAWGFLLATPPPTTFAEALRAAREVPPAFGEANLTAGCSTHTHLRAACRRLGVAFQPAATRLLALQRVSRTSLADAGRRVEAAATALSADLEGAGDPARPLAARLREVADLGDLDLDRDLADVAAEASAALALVPAGRPAPQGAREGRRDALLRRAGEALRALHAEARALREARAGWLGTGQEAVARHWARAREVLEAELQVWPARAAGPGPAGGAAGPPAPPPAPVDRPADADRPAAGADDLAPPVAGPAWALRWPDLPARLAAPAALLVAPSFDLPRGGPVDWSRLALATQDLAPPAGLETVFVRFARLRVGGGPRGRSPTLALRAAHAGRAPFDLLRGEVALPAGAPQVLELRRAPFLALPSGRTLALELSAWDVGVTPPAALSRARAPLGVDAADLPLDREVVVEQPDLEVERPPGYALAFVRTRTRGRDAASRWGLRKHLGWLLVTPAPRTPWEAALAGRCLPDALERARLALACSTHTRLRAAGARILAALGDGPAALEALAGLDAPDLPLARRGARAAALRLDAALATADPARPLVGALGALAAARDLAGLRRELAAARAALPDGGAVDPRPPEAREALRQAAGLVAAFAAAARLHEDWGRAGEQVARGWDAARAALEAELR